MTRPSSTPDTVDKTLHPVGTVFLHLIGHVTVDIQRKCCCGVSQVIELYTINRYNGVKEVICLTIQNDAVSLCDKGTESCFLAVSPKNRYKYESMKAASHAVPYIQNLTKLS